VTIFPAIKQEDTTPSNRKGIGATMYRKVLISSVLVMVLAACRGGDAKTATVLTATLAPPDTQIFTSTDTFINPTAPIVTAKPTLTPESMVVPTDDPNRLQFVENGGFDTNTNSWKRAYGSFSHTTSEYHTAPGSARLGTTDNPTGSGHFGTIGQCIDLKSQLDNWPEVTDHKHLAIEAYMQTNESIDRVTLNGIFSDDPRCGPGHVGNLGTPAIMANQTWTRIFSTAEIPETTQSIHVFVWATGMDASGIVYIDDIQIYPLLQELTLSPTEMPPPTEILTPSPTLPG